MGDLVELQSGLATSVGPVPFVDPEDAVRFSLGTNPRFPSVPSAGAGANSLLAQAVAGLPGVVASSAGTLEVDHDHFDVATAVDLATSGRLSVGGDSFRMLQELLCQIGAHAATTEGFEGVRVALVGPVSLALALRAAGVDLEDACVLAGALVPMRAAALLGAVRAAVPDGLVMVALNEAGLVGAAHPTFPLSPHEVHGLLVPVVAALDEHPHAGSLLIAAHVPGRTDWDTVIASGVSVLSAPSGPGLTGWASSLNGFLDRGGRVAWGAVPVDQPLGSSEQLLWRKLSAVWCELVAEGVDPLALRSRSFVSPVDGLGHFGATQAELAVGLVDALSVKVRRQALAARLSLGA